jgi:hypothetical protein
MTTQDVRPQPFAALSPPRALSPAARAFWAQMHALPDGVPESVARAQLGPACDQIIHELTAAWLLLTLPGAPSGKTTRASRLVAAPLMEHPTRLDVTFAARRLSGRSGTLLALARHLDRSPGHTLGVMRALVRAELASGGPVGATFAFQVPQVVRRGG